MTENNDETNMDCRRRSEKLGDYVSIYLRGEVWWINYQNLKGRQVRKSLRTRSKKQAKILALRKESELLQGREPGAANVATIDEAITAYDAYLVAEGRPKKTLGKYRLVFQRVRNVATLRGVKDLRGVNLQFVDGFRSQLKDAGAQPRTIHNQTTILRQLVNFAISRDMVDRDPLKGMKLKRPKTGNQPWWTFDQVELILDALRDDPYCSLFGVLARTGLRISEAKYLAWEDVDLANRVLHVRGKQINDDGERWTPKGKDERVVPLSSAVTDIFQALPRNARWVFTTPSRLKRLAGHPIDERRTLLHLKKALKTLDLPGHQHTFRHSLISHALVSGTPPAVVRRWAGHVDDNIMKLYTHIADEDSKAYMVKLFDGGEAASQAARKDVEPNEDGGGQHDVKGA